MVADRIGLAGIALRGTHTTTETMDSIAARLETEIRTDLIMALLRQTNPEVPMTHFVETEGMTLGEICERAELTADEIKEIRELSN